MTGPFGYGYTPFTPSNPTGGLSKYADDYGTYLKWYNSLPTAQQIEAKALQDKGASLSEIQEFVRSKFIGDYSGPTPYAPNKAPKPNFFESTPQQQAAILPKKSASPTSMLPTTPEISDSVLQEIARAMAEANTTQDPTSFLGQARGQVSSIYGPQYGALDQARKNAQTQYDRNDPIIAGLYANLQNDIQGQAGAKRAAIEPAALAQQGAGTALAGEIGNTYSKTQSGLGDLFQRLGIQAAAPDALAPGAAQSARQQSTALTNNQAQVDYGRNLGNTQADWLSNIGNAAQSKGAQARNDLLTQLADAFANLDMKRSELSGREAADVQSAARELANSATSANQNKLQNLVTMYGLQSGKEGDAWKRAMDIAGLNASTAGKPPEVTEATALVNKMLNSKYPHADEIMKIASSTAAGGSLNSVNGTPGNLAMTDKAAFINYVVQQAQRQFPNDPTAASAATEAAAFWADKLGFKSLNTG